MPDNSISYFQNSILKDGVARPSRYLIDVIAAGPQDENGNSQIHTFRKHPQSVTLPSRSFVTMKEQWHGPEIDVPVCPKYEGDVVMTFAEDEYGQTRDFFDTWMNGLVIPHGLEFKTNYGIGTENAKIKIHLLNEMGEIFGSYALHDVYASDIMPVNLAAGAFNDFMQISVRFQYKYYVYYMTDDSRSIMNKIKELESDR